MSTSAGFAVGYAVSLFLITNPVGWGTTIVLAVGTAAGSYATGKFSRKIYSTQGREIDFVTGLGVSELCLKR